MRGTAPWTAPEVEAPPLYADRMALIDTENAFKVGPYIKEVEDAGHLRVVRCNLGEPDFPLPKHIAAEVKRQIDNDLTHYCPDILGFAPLWPKFLTSAPVAASRAGVEARANSNSIGRTLCAPTGDTCIL